VTGRLDELLESLLYEGYALYPYTPGAAKNATPTPFGIVYPPAYAARSGSTFDHLRLEGLVIDAAPAARLAAEVRFLQPVGERHRAEERRVELAAPLGGRAETPFSYPPLEGRVALESAPAGDGCHRVTVLVENATGFEGDGRAEALGRSLVSTHPLVRVDGGRFLSPLEADGCESVNTWPVLATDSDDVLLGAAIVLPDHPRLAPSSTGNLFDGTEIEEALVLHVQALSEGELEGISEQDPAVRAMVERVGAVTPDQLRALHGLMHPARDPRDGEPEAEVGGVVYRRGGSVVLRPGPGADAHDLLLSGRRATIERIYRDVEDRVYLGVTVDEDPGRTLMRESGRYYYFFADEVEAAAG
jgi:hypothetical protein